MKFSPRQQPVDGLPGVSGTARVDRRTSGLVRRLRPGDIAVIDHLDLDRAHAQQLVDAGVVAVVNASPFISGRYPNLGPELLAKAGVPMLEVLRQDYIRTARSKGVSEGGVNYNHALRNAVVPVVTIIGIEAAFLIGGLGGALLSGLRIVDRKRFPFGPFMLVAALVAVAVGPWVAGRFGY